MMTSRESLAWMESFTQEAIDEAQDREKMIETKQKHFMQIVGFFEQ